MTLVVTLVVLSMNPALGSYFVRFPRRMVSAAVIAFLLFPHPLKEKSWKALFPNGYNAAANLMADAR